MQVEEEILFYQFRYRVQINKLYITSVSKHPNIMSGLVPKKNQCCIVDTAVIKMRFCMITYRRLFLDFSISYFGCFQRYMHKRALDLVNKHDFIVPCQRLSFFQNMFFWSLKNTFQKNFIFGDNQSQKLSDSYPLPHIQYWLKCWFSGLVQHLVKNQEKFWVSLIKSSFF